MDVIQMTRELGKAIQQDERYLNFSKIREANENDRELMDLVGQIQLIQLNFQQESSKENPDEDKLREYNEEFEKVYAVFAANENMQAYEKARKEIDEMMNYLMQILSLCVNGEDPETCEPHVHNHDCGGECSSCAGCH